MSFKELGWVVAVTAVVWAMATLDRGYVAVGGEVLLPVLYYFTKWSIMTLIEVVEEIGEESVE